jgi:hypothetical protein
VSPARKVLFFNPFTTTFDHSQITRKLPYSNLRVSQASTEVATQLLHIFIGKKSDFSGRVCGNLLTWQQEVNMWESLWKFVNMATGSKHMSTLNKVGEVLDELLMIMTMLLVYKIKIICPL